MGSEDKRSTKTAYGGCMWARMRLMLEKKDDLQARSSSCAPLGRVDGAGAEGVFSYPWQQQLPYAMWKTKSGGPGTYDI